LLIIRAIDQFGNYITLYINWSKLEGPEVDKKWFTKFTKLSRDCEFHCRQALNIDNDVCEQKSESQSVQPDENDPAKPDG
jgi:hypothetical protein